MPSQTGVFRKQQKEGCGAGNKIGDKDIFDPPVAAINKMKDIFESAVIEISIEKRTEQQEEEIQPDVDEDVDEFDGNKTPGLVL